MVVVVVLETTGVVVVVGAKPFFVGTEGHGHSMNLRLSTMFVTVVIVGFLAENS